MLHLDLAENYRNDQQDAIQSVYLYKCFRIFTSCSYPKSPNNDSVTNDVILVTESSDHDRVTSMSCQQNVVHKIKHMHEKTYENIYVWSDGMGSHFKSRCIFKLLARKGPVDAVGGMVKKVILRKVKPDQLVVHSPLEVSESMAKLVPSIHSVYLPGNENIVKPEDISIARKTNQTLKIHKAER